jgi:hypothetical protein
VEEDITTHTSAAYPAPLILFGMIILTLSGVRYKGLFVRELINKFLFSRGTKFFTTFMKTNQ